jgi:diguanylate cyclase (GGDEF)-like protein/PAS domain S-box-containing protein
MRESTLDGLGTWRQLIEQLPDAVLCLNAELMVVFQNRNAEQLLGYQSDELADLALATLIIDGTSERSLDAETLSQMVLSGEIREIQLKHKNSSLIPALLSISALSNPGQPDETLSLATLKDIRKLDLYNSKLHRDKKLFEILFNNINEAVFLAPLSPDGIHGNFVEVNDVACRRLGYSRQELLSMNARTLNPMANLGKVKAFGKHIRREGNTIFEAIHVAKDGTQFPVEVVAKVIDIESQEYVLSVVRDLRDSKRLQQTEARFGRLIDHSWEEIYIFDSESLKFLQVNQGALNNLGYSSKEMQQLQVTDIKPEISKEDFTKLAQPLFDGSRSRIIFETVHQRRDGSVYPVEIRLQLSHSEVPPVFLANVQDITERKKAENHLQYLANYDSLTGLPNRSLFLDRLSMAMANSKRTNTLTALLYLDMDEFKSINDTLGHLAGDDLLRQVSRRLQNCARKSDTVARLGGDEFTMVVSNLRNIDGLEKVIHKILDSINVPFRINGQDLLVSTSLGVTVYPFGDEEDVYALVKQADSAMYQAKRSGKNTFQYYTAQLWQSEIRRVKLEHALKNALPHCKEFEVLYQPRVNLRSSKIVGAEALLRFNHPEFGVVSPAEFIPIVEKLNLIHDVGEWVLRQACKQLRLWLNNNIEFHISVNVSARQLDCEDFVTQLSAALNDSGVCPENLEIEITEGVLVSHSEQASNALLAIKDLGAKISLDDFGSGYSSLNYLKRFAINVLKIDRSFVMDIGNNTDSEVIVQAVIGLAKNLGLQVTAEGIETEAQLEFLKDSGCHEGQGYYFCKPISAAQLEKMLLEQVKKAS